MKIYLTYVIETLLVEKAFKDNQLLFQSNQENFQNLYKCK